jgi:chromate transport protein ChrA
VRKIEFLAQKSKLCAGHVTFAGNMTANGLMESERVHNGHGISTRRFARFEAIAQIDVLQS